MFDTLDEVQRDIARRLARAARDRKSPMHTPVVATADADARVMVLRAFAHEDWQLRFHTDARAPKALAIGKADGEGAPVGLVFYDKAQKVQIRLRGRGRIETDSERAEAAWAASTNFARRCYLGDAPGAVSPEPTSGLPAWAEGEEPSEEQIAPAREAFAILLVEARALDWLYLAHDGHLRAQFERAVGGAWTGRWVAP